MFLELTAKENLMYLAGFRKIIDKGVIEEVLTSVGLDPQDRTKVRKFSLGMKKRLLIAQGIMEQPDIFIVDEPANSLDETGVNMLYDVIDKVRQRGAIVIMTSHYKEDIEQLCDVIYEIKEGKLCFKEGVQSV